MPAIEPQVTFRNMKPRQEVTDEIRQRCEKLSGIHERLTRCEVVVELPHRAQHKGNLFHVRVHATFPHGEIIVGRDPEKAVAHEDPHVAIRDAFDAAERQLKSTVDRQRAKKKH